MATDRTIIPAQGSGGDTNVPVASKDDASGLKHQQVVVETMVATTPTPVSTSAPLPISDAGGSITVDGTVTVNGTVTATTGGLTDTQLRASAVPVSGTVTTSPPSNASTNIAQIAGNTPQTGHGVATGALRVELPTDGTGIVGLAAGANAIGTVTANLGTIAGVATAAKQPGIGTAGTANADVLSVQGIASGTPLNVAGTFSASGTTDLTASGNLTASGQTVAITTLNGMSACQIDVSGTYTHSLLSEATVDGTNWFGITTPFVSAQSGGSAGRTTNQILANGRYQVPVAGFSGVRVNCTLTGTGTAVIALRASAAAGVNQNLATVGNVAVDTNSGTMSSGTQRVTIASDSTGQVKLAAGVAAIGSLTAGSAIVGKVGIDQTTPGTTNAVTVKDSLGNSTNSAGPGFLKVTDEPTQLFYDPFDSALDTTNVWTSTTGSSGVAAAVSTGTVTMGTGTVANGYSKLTSIPTFKPPIPGWVVYSDAIALPDGAAVVANSYRFWGAGTTPGTPTATAPITDGYGFEMTTAGHLCCVVYAGGVRTLIADLFGGAQPTNANYHRYIVQIRTDLTYFYIDSIASSGLVATTSFQSSQQQILPKLFLAVGAATPPVSNVQITCTGAVVSDTGKNATQLADGTFPWRKAAISSAGAVSTSLTSLPALTTGAAVIGSLVANQSVNQAQVGGTAVDTNSGNKSAGTQRIVIATDQPNLTTALNVSLAANQSVNAAQINGVTPLMGTGVTGTGSLRVTIATDQVQLTNALKVDPSGVTSPVSLASVPSHAVTNAGTFAVQAATELATGLTTFSNTALSSTKTAVKAGAGKVYGWMIHNPSAATTFLQVWNVAIGSITVGTTAPTYVLAIPAGASANVMSERGITHSTEINVAATTTATGSSAPATALVTAIFYI